MFDHYDASGLPVACDKAEAELRELRADDARWEETVGDLNEKVIQLTRALARAEETAAQYKAESERLGDFANAKVQQITAAKAALARIAEAHSKHVDEHGGTTGACNECSWNWPCPTYAWATTNRDPNGPWDPADDEESADV